MSASWHLHRASNSRNSCGVASTGFGVLVWIVILWFAGVCVVWILRRLTLGSEHGPALGDACRNVEEFDVLDCKT